MYHTELFFLISWLYSGTSGTCVKEEPSPPMGHMATRYFIPYFPEYRTIQVLPGVETWHALVDIVLYVRSSGNTTIYDANSAECFYNMSVFPLEVDLDKLFLNEGAWPKVDIWLMSSTDVVVHLSTRTGSSLALPPLASLGQQYILLGFTEGENDLQSEFIYIFNVSVRTSVRVCNKKETDNRLDEETLPMKCSPLQLPRHKGLVFNSTGQMDGVWMIANKPFGILTASEDYSVINNELDNATASPVLGDLRAEAVPELASWGRQFVIIPQSQDNEFHLKAIGYFPGTLDIWRGETNYTTYSFDAYQTLSLHIEPQTFVLIKSSVPIEILVTEWLQTLDNNLKRSTYFVPPVDWFTTSSWILVQQTTPTACIFAVLLNSTIVPNVTGLDDSFKPCTSVQTVNINDMLYNVVKFCNITPGLYKVSADVDGLVKFVIYLLDIVHGQFYPYVNNFSSTAQTTSLVRLLLGKYKIEQISSNFTDTQSNRNFKERTSQLSFSKSSLYLNTSLHSNVTNESLSSYKRKSMNASDQKSTNQTSDNLYREHTNFKTSTRTISTTPIARRASSGHSRTLFTPIQIVLQHSSEEETRLQYNTRYIISDDNGELEEEDSRAAGNLMAVIISLSVALFAVASVITTFLVLELFSRRTQIRNAKIRPYLS